VLNGKTKDSNSNFMAKMLFDLGIDLKRYITFPRENGDLAAD
jgi:molybdopterin-biosynthesis enzyme MoeA-like protein